MILEKKYDTPEQLEAAIHAACPPYGERRAVFVVRQSDLGYGFRHLQLHGFASNEAIIRGIE